jgi:DNA-binding NtrC family response regulator
MLAPYDPSARMCILIVEPDSHVRAMAADVLEQEGFEVIEAPSADYAATLLHSRNDVRVLLTEIASPGDLNGFDLARIAQAHNPHIVVIVVAGGCHLDSPEPPGGSICTQALSHDRCDPPDP